MSIDKTTTSDSGRAHKAGEHEPEKTGGVNANLWTGLALILVAVFFMGWARLRPIVVPEDFDRPDDDPTRPAPQRKRPPAH